MITSFVWALLLQGAAAALNKLPNDIAAHIKNASWNLACHDVNLEFDDPGAALNNRYMADKHLSAIRELSTNFLHNQTVNDFEDLAIKMSRCVIRSGLHTCFNYSVRDTVDHVKCPGLESAIQRWQNHSVMVSDLKGLVQSLTNEASCLALAVRKQDLTVPIRRVYFDHLGKMIGGAAKMMNITFDVDRQRVLRLNPKVVAEQVLENDSENKQSMSFSVKYKEGQSRHWAHNIHFKVATENGFKTGFFGNAKGTKLIFEAEYGYEWSGGKSRESSRNYNYNLEVPPHKKYEAKAVIHEAHMEVPYVMQISIGDQTYKNYGIWAGVAVSQAVFKIKDVSEPKPKLLLQGPRFEAVTEEASTSSRNAAVIFGCAGLVSLAVFSSKQLKRVSVFQPPLLGT